MGQKFFIFKMPLSVMMLLIVDMALGRKGSMPMCFNLSCVTQGDSTFGCPGHTQNEQIWISESGA